MKAKKPFTVGDWNEKCLICQKTCKQFANVKIVGCPLFIRIEKKEKPNAEDK